jgi:hypothetical protein
MERVGGEAAKGIGEGAVLSLFGIGAKALLPAAKGIAGRAAIKTAAKAGMERETQALAANIARGAVSKTMPNAAVITGLAVGGAAVEGRMPTAEDFVDASAIIMGLKGVNKMGATAYKAGRKKAINYLHDKFIIEGKTPDEVLAEVKADPLKLDEATAYEREQVRKGYEEVKAEPLKGTREGKDDILATLKPDDLRTYIINRGAAIKDKSGDTIVWGPELKAATGTEDNFGFSKMIFKHNITVEEAVKLPNIIREYEPIKDAKGEQVWRVPSDEAHNLRVVFSKDNSLLTVIRESKKLERKYEVSKKKEAAVPDMASSDQTQDTNQAGFAPNAPAKGGAPDSAASTNSIPDKAGEVNSYKFKKTQSIKDFIRYQVNVDIGKFITGETSRFGGGVIVSMPERKLREIKELYKTLDFADWSATETLITVKEGRSIKTPSDNIVPQEVGDVNGGNQAAPAKYYISATNPITGEREFVGGAGLSGTNRYGAHLLDSLKEAQEYISW